MWPLCGTGHDQWTCRSLQHPVRHPSWRIWKTQGYVGGGGGGGGGMKFVIKGIILYMLINIFSAANKTNFDIRVLV